MIATGKKRATRFELTARSRNARHTFAATRSTGLQKSCWPVYAANRIERESRRLLFCALQNFRLIVRLDVITNSKMCKFCLLSTSACRLPDRHTYTCRQHTDSVQPSTRSRKTLQRRTRSPPLTMTRRSAPRRSRSARRRPARGSLLSPTRRPDCCCRPIERRCATTRGCACARAFPTAKAAAVKIRERAASGARRRGER